MDYLDGQSTRLIFSSAGLSPARFRKGNSTYRLACRELFIDLTIFSSMELASTISSQSSTKIPDTSRSMLPVQTTTTKRKRDMGDRQKEGTRTDGVEG